MDSPEVYTDPQAPGAPRVGDLVTVVSEMHPDHLDVWDTDPMPLDGCTATLVGHVNERSRRYKWAVIDGTGCIEWVYSVRRPTEAEIAQWALGCSG